MSNEKKSDAVQAIEQRFSNKFDCGFSIDEYQRPNGDNAIAIHSTLPMDFDVPYKNDDEKQFILDSLTTVAEKFDFSSKVDIEEIDELDSFVKKLV